MKEPGKGTDATAAGELAGFIVMRTRPKWNGKVTLAASGFTGGEGSSPSFEC